MTNTDKTLPLIMVQKAYHDTQNNRTVDYFRFVVVVNGIEIALKPTDNTARQILVAYFTSQGGNN